jgi:hypothetical protein
MVELWSSNFLQSAISDAQTGIETAGLWLKLCVIERKREPLPSGETI